MFLRSAGPDWFRDTVGGEPAGQGGGGWWRGTRCHSDTICVLESLSGSDAALYPGDMFVRTATRRNKDGSAVRYLQLVHNEWDPATKSSRMRVLHSFGREDQLDRAAVGRLAGSLGRLLGPEPARRPPAGAGLRRARSPSAGPTCWTSCGSGWGSAGS